MNSSLIKERLEESSRVKLECLKEAEAIRQIASAAVDCLKNGGKIFFFGNGGSAADAHHLCAEIVSRFYMERRGLPAEALSTNTSVLTAIANDYSFEMIFSKQIEASGREGDVAVGISTSGNSPNVIEAIRTAKGKGMLSVGFTGKKGGKLKELADICFCAPSDDTPRIQEAHITVGHIICELIEREIFGKDV